MATSPFNNSFLIGQENLVDKEKEALKEIYEKSAQSHLANVLLDPLWHRQVTAKVVSVPKN